MESKKRAFYLQEIKSYSDVPVPEIHFFDDSMKILPYAYTIMSKLDGMPIDKKYHRTKTRIYFFQAGEILSKLHSIKFNKFGWLLDNEIYPAFNTWKDFVWHDIQLKTSRLDELSEFKKLIPKIENFLNIYTYLLNVKEKTISSP
jgi:hypothetical protein